MNCRRGNLGSLVWHSVIFMLVVVGETHGKEQLRFRRGPPIIQRPSRPIPNRIQLPGNRFPNPIGRQSSTGNRISPANQPAKGSSLPTGGRNGNNVPEYSKLEDYLHRQLPLPHPHPPSNPNQIQQPSSNRIPITLVGRRFISLLENSNDQGLQILARKYKSTLINLDIENLLLHLEATATKPNDQHKQELNNADLQNLQKWQATWKFVEADFVKNIDKNSETYKEGTDLINQAIKYYPIQPTRRPLHDPLLPTRKPGNNIRVHGQVGERNETIDIPDEFANKPKGDYKYITTRKPWNDIQIHGQEMEHNEATDIPKEDANKPKGDYKYIIPTSTAGVAVFLIISIAVGIHLVLLKRFEFHPNIDHTQLKVVSDLGRGNFASVSLVEYQPYPGASGCCKKCLLKPVLAAAKLLTPADTSDAQPTVFSGSVQGSVDEIVVRKLKHSNIVRIFGLCLNFKTTVSTSICRSGIPPIQCKTIATIFEYMDLGDCEEYLQKHCSIWRSPHMAGHYLLTVCSIFLDVSKAFIYLRGQKIVHRDLAARNVLLKSKNSILDVQAKVGDFGLAKLMKQKARLDNGTYCDAYIGLPNEVVDQWITAPESKTSQPQFTTYSDVYSFGIFISVCINLIEDLPKSTSIIPFNQSEVLSVTEVVASTPYAQIEQIGKTFHQQQSIRSNSDKESGNTVPCRERMNRNIQKVIQDMRSLSNVCAKNNMHERITFENLRKALLVLKKKYLKMGIGKGNIDCIDLAVKTEVTPSWV